MENKHPAPPDKVVFIPDEDIKALQRIYSKMEQAHRELSNVADQMKKLKP